MAKKNTISLNPERCMIYLNKEDIACVDFLMTTLNLHKSAVMRMALRTFTKAMKARTQHELERFKSDD